MGVKSASRMAFHLMQHDREGAQIMATYHPSYLLRLRGPDYELARDEMAADLSRAWAAATA